MTAGDHVHQGPTVGEPGNWRTLSPFTFDGGAVMAFLDPERGEDAGRSALELGRVGGSHLEPARELESIPWLFICSHCRVDVSSTVITIG